MLLEHLFQHLVGIHQVFANEDIQLDATGLHPQTDTGNDVSDDMVVTELGMKVFLHTDCLINHKNADISGYPSGSWKEMQAYLEKLSGDSSCF